MLRFHAGNELVEITGKSNMLQASDFGTVWVHFLAAALDTQTEVIDFTAAGSMDYLLPRKQAHED